MEVEATVQLDCIGQNRLKGPLRLYLCAKIREFFLTPLHLSSSSDVSLTLSDFLMTRKSAENVAMKYSWNTEACLRLLRASVSLGLLKTDDGKFFEWVESSFEMAELERDFHGWLDGNSSDPEDTVLESDRWSADLSGSFRISALVLRYYRKVVSRFLGSSVVLKGMETGKSVAQYALKIDSEQIFDFYSSRPDLLSVYLEAFAEMNGPGNERVAEISEFRNAGSLLDVGASVGQLTRAICRRNTNIKTVTNYDFYTAKSALVSLRDRYGDYPRGCTVKWEFGDFFRGDVEKGFEGISTDSSYDVITFAWILHDWDDERCVSILKRARRHLSPGGSIMVIEKCLDEGKVGDVALIDFVMMLMAGGRERTLSEYKRLFAASGYQYEKYHVFPGFRDVIVARSL